MFDAQRLCASQIKTISHGSDVSRKAELVPAKKATRIENQKTRLLGVELTGPLGRWGALMHLMIMLQRCWNRIRHYTWKHTGSQHEPVKLQVRKPGKELMLDNVNVTVKGVVPRDKCQISNEHRTVIGM